MRRPTSKGMNLGPDFAYLSALRGGIAVRRRDQPTSPASKMTLILEKKLRILNYFGNTNILSLISANEIQVFSSRLPCNITREMGIVGKSNR